MPPPALPADIATVVSRAIAEDLRRRRPHGRAHRAAHARRRARRRTRARDAMRPRLVRRDVSPARPARQRRLARRRRRRDRRRRDRLRAPRARAQHRDRRAHGAELPADAVGHRDGHALARRHRRGHAHAHPRHAQDAAGPAPRAEVRRALRRRRESPHRPVRRDADQGEPHRRRRQRQRSRRRSAAPVAATS